MLILACMVSFGSCSSDDDNGGGYEDPAVSYKKILVGTWVRDSSRWYTPQYGLIPWRASESDLTDTLEFHSDGTAVDRSQFYSQYSRTEFTWDVSVAFIFDGSRTNYARYRINSIQQNKLYLESVSDDPIQYLYRRLK